MTAPSDARRESDHTPSGAADAAYQGTVGAFSEDAARALLGEDVRLQPCPTLDDVFLAIARARARRAIVPIENTLAGSVPGCGDLISRHGVRIVAERIQPIVHALIAPPGATLQTIRRVLSHPVALAQCRRFFDAQPTLEPVPALDTAGAAADVVAAGRLDAAAIASRRAAAVHGGVVLADAIQDCRDNFTRFLLLEPGAAPEPLQSGLKTSLTCVLCNEPGALVRALNLFAERGLNLCRIESRPIADAPFEYEFHLDLSPTDDEQALREAVTQLRQSSKRIKVLGQYVADRVPADRT